MFEIERKAEGGEFVRIGYVNGYGTTTEPQHYSYIDQTVGNGQHYYRLKQINFDGTFEYSSEVMVKVSVPNEFALEQNYPNPFNPSTKIDFSLAVDSQVTLKVFNVLGEEVKTLINGDFAAGKHEVEFNASELNSGIYFYRIEAIEINVESINSTKKMILLK
jgi:hypothetical protein